MPRMPGSSRAARCIRQVEARAQCRGPKYGIRRVGRGPSWSQDAVAHAWLINDAPCTPWPPAPVMTRRQANPAAQPASTHCSHFLATTHGRAGSCHAGLSLQSLRTFCSARPTALRRRANRPTSASGRPIAANTRAPPMHVRCSPRAAEHRYLGRIRRLRVFRIAFIRRRGKAGPRPPHFHDRCELPGISRIDRGSRPEYDAPVYAGQWLRTDPDTACWARSTDVDAGARPSRR